MPQVQRLRRAETVAKIGWDLFAADLERDIIQAAVDLAGKEEIILTVEEIVEIVIRDR